MSKTMLILMACASVLVGLASGQSAKPLQSTNRSPMQTADDKAKAQARPLLEAADMYLALGDGDAARAQILEALKAIEGDGVTEATKSQVRGAVKTRIENLRKAKQAASDTAKQAQLASQDKTKRKNLAQLEVAQSLLSNSKPDEALRVVQQVLGESNNPEVIAKANEILEMIGSPWGNFLSTVWQHLLTVFQWLSDIIIGGFVFFVLYWLLKAGRNVSVGKHGKKWKVNPIEDTTNLGVAGAVVESLNGWKEERPRASAGLLKLGIVQIPTKPVLKNPDVEIDLAAAFEDLKLNIGGVSMGGIAKAAASIRKWWVARRSSISGTAVLSGDQVVVSLTRRDAKGVTNTVTASAKKGQSIDAAEAASFKMYYLISTGSTVSEAEAANKLRIALNLLGEHIAGGIFDKLEAAHQAFRNILIENPTFEEACLYEAVALDLLEDHNEAIKRFHFLSDPENTSNDDLRKKALYNEAVSRFRKYNPAEIQKAINAFDGLIGQDDSVDVLVASPLKALSFAAKANAIAHKPIFWQGPNPVSGNHELVLKRKIERHKEVDGWVAEVEAMSTKLWYVYIESANRKQEWDDITRRQLKWAMESARGNVYLNYAMHYLHPPHRPQAHEATVRQQYRQKAYEAFQICEMVLPPSVETLADLGTVLSELSKEIEAREYLERAVKTNPRYEYVYYRLAQSWEKEGKVEEVIEVLKRFRAIRPPHIPEFVKLYNKYSKKLDSPPKNRLRKNDS